MYALPVFVVKSNEQKLHEGILLKLPAELRSKPQLTYYSRLSDGWHVCPQQYIVYVVSSTDGTKYVVPGLNIDGEKKSTKRYYSKTNSFSKVQIVEFGASLTSESDRIAKAKDDDLRGLVHDLRALSSAIYNSALEAKTECEQGKNSIAQDCIETVIATHTMLSIRIDFLDFVTNQFTTSDFGFVPVYKKVDKVVRCFRPKATARGMNIDLRGPSFGLTRGPSIFELIPYAIIDNAIKYSPPGQTVYVTVKDYQRDVSVDVKSFGPYISQKERGSIFDKWSRGAEAIRTGKAGSGAGLYTTKQLIEEYFEGSITVDQDPAPKLFGLERCYATNFQILVPREER